MNNQFRKPGMGERVQQLGYLLKNTVTIVGRDRDITRPWLRTAIYATVMITAFFAGIGAIALGAAGTGTLLLIAAVLLFLYKYFYYTRQEMAQSWLVAEVVRGRDAVPGDGRKRVRTLKSQARYLGWASLAFAFVSSRTGSGEGGGMRGMLIRMALSALTEVWDLAKHFLTPTVVIDEYGLREGAEKLKTLKNHIPETLMGVFGIDIAGGAAGAIVAPVYLLLIVIAIALGLLVGDAVPAFHAGDAAALFGNQPPSWLGNDPWPFSWLPLLVALWIGKLFGAIFARLVDAVKVNYYTLFYLRITHPGDIAPDLADQLEAYLRIESDDSSATAESASQPT